MESSNRPKRQRINDREIENEILRDFDDSDLSGFSEFDDSDADKDFHASSESTDGSSSGKKHLCTILGIIFYGLISKIHSIVFLIINILSILCIKTFCRYITYK